MFESAVSVLSSNTTGQICSVHESLLSLIVDEFVVKAEEVDAVVSRHYQLIINKI